VYAYVRLQDTQITALGQASSTTIGLDPLERLYLGVYLTLNAEKVNHPLSSVEEEIRFIIEPGQSADQIAANLVAANILSDSELFRRYVRYEGLDNQLEAGTYLIGPGMSIAELALFLTVARPEEIELRFIEGWRYEQMANYIRTLQPAKIDADEFELIASGQTKPDFLDFDLLRSLPENASLEGFLFPDTYRLPIDADATQLIGMMLENFDQQVTPSLRQSYGFHGLSVYDAVTLASIVQREAVVAEERPLMVRVFLNRLEQGIKLQADPTVQYALGYQADQELWWKSPLSATDLEIDSPYNTYRYSGLPPAPISNPGLEALEAVANPIDSDFLFFVVDCNSEIEGAHVFSRTYDEHLTNVERCRHQ
jgi:UPF0755 protein